jgi:hypothetical protein
MSVAARLGVTTEMTAELVFRGAQSGNRTHDLRITSALLYRLSYLGGGCRSVASGLQAAHRITAVAGAGL